MDIKASGVCHSDLNYRDGVGTVGHLPIILGHEIAGVVDQIGEGVEGFEVGDRVLVHYVLSCGGCRYCSLGKENLCERYAMIGKDVDGGFAEYIAVPARNLVKLPEGLPFEQGAILGCAVSTPLHALRRAQLKPGEVVVVYGVGGLGVHAVQLASRVYGAGLMVAVDVAEYKLELAKRLGADVVVNPLHEDPVERVREETDGRMADVVVELVGKRETIMKGIECVGRGGRMVLVGIGLEEITLSPYRTIIGKEMELIGVNDHLKSELYQLVDLIASGRLDLSASITHRLAPEEANRALEILEHKLGNPVRVVLVQ
ncbi:MAG: alcohol dehydrogenase [Candidatus Bathyarchaeota archaeon B23]|nr:MAG: alcohol dehydrogenase [Candidatus Bathyarchaeota archaeon B23]